MIVEPKSYVKIVACKMSSLLGFCAMMERMTRLLVLSDIHGNFHALESVLEDARDEYDALCCLGDVVGYGPCPNECVALIREKAKICVIGNHDWAALGRAGVDVDNFNPIARDAILWTRNQLSAESRAYLEDLPAEPLRIEGSEAFLVTHASPREPVWEYILTPSIAMENFAAFHEPICLVGHTHKPVIFRWRVAQAEPGEYESIRPTYQAFAPETDIQETDADASDPQGSHWIASVDMLNPAEDTPTRLETSPRQRLILNPGSVGQPRDNDARAAYAIMDVDAGTWTFRRVEYPIELTQSQMRSAGLPQRLIDRLSFGW